MAMYCLIEVTSKQIKDRDSCSDWMDLIDEAFSESEIKNWCKFNYPEWFDEKDD